MRISDWSSDVCSSDLVAGRGPACRAQGRSVLPRTSSRFPRDFGKAPWLDRRSLDSSLPPGPRIQAFEHCAIECKPDASPVHRYLGRLCAVRLTRQLRNAHEVLIHRPGALAALADRPDHQRLAAAHVAATEDVGRGGGVVGDVGLHVRSEEHTSELQSLMRISYAVFCLKKQKRST